jgi:hypothetical protein
MGEEGRLLVHRRRREAVRPMTYVIDCGYLYELCDRLRLMTYYLAGVLAVQTYELLFSGQRPSRETNAVACERRMHSHT